MTAIMAVISIMTIILIMTSAVAAIVIGYKDSAGVLRCRAIAGLIKGLIVCRYVFRSEGLAYAAAVIFLNDFPVAVGLKAVCVDI